MRLTRCRCLNCSPNRLAHPEAGHNIPLACLESLRQVRSHPERSVDVVVE